MFLSRKLSQTLNFYFLYVSTKIKALICIKKAQKTHDRNSGLSPPNEKKNKLHNNELQELDLLLSKLVTPPLNNAPPPKKKHREKNKGDNTGNRKCSVTVNWQLNVQEVQSIGGGGRAWAWWQCPIRWQHQGTQSEGRRGTNDAAWRWACHHLHSTATVFWAGEAEDGLMAVSEEPEELVEAVVWDTEEEHTQAQTR